MRKPRKTAFGAAVGSPPPKNGKKKKVAMTGDMGGMLGVTAKKPEPDNNLRKKQSSARMARLSGKLI